MDRPFHIQIAENRTRLAMFLLLYLVLTVLTGWITGLALEPVFDGQSHMMRRAYGIWLPWQPRPGFDGPPPFLESAVFKVMLAFLGASTAYFLYLLRHGRMMVLNLVGAKVLQERRLQNTAEEMAIAAGLARPPTVWLIEDDSSNAFACADSTGQGAVAVTRGLLERLERDELQAVVAHETAHLRNGDTRIMTLLFGVTRVLDVVHWLLFRWLKVFVWAHRRARAEERRQAREQALEEGPDIPDTERGHGEGAPDPPLGPDPAVARQTVLDLRHELETLNPILFLLFLAVIAVMIASFGAILLGPVVFLVLADRWELVTLGLWLPLALMLVRLAVSRNREYQADMTAVRLTRNPDALRRALAKLRQDERRPQRLTPSLAPLCIAPLVHRARGGTWATRLEEGLYDNGALDKASRESLWRWARNELPPHRQLMALIFVPLATLLPLLWAVRVLERLAGLFATHPPLDERIRRLAEAGA